MHELADFSVQTGAVILTAALFAVLALAPHVTLVDRNPDESAGRRRFGRLLLLTALLLPGLVVAAPHWDAVRCMAREAARVDAGEASWPEVGAAEWRWHPTSFTVPLRVGVEEAAYGRYREAIGWLNRAQWLAPRHPSPHLYAARVLQRIGASSQGLTEYRLAIEGDWRYQARPVLEEAAARYQTAEELARLLPTDRDDAPAMFARWLVSVKDPRAAWFADLARERRPDAVSTIVAVTESLLLQRRGDEAVIWIERAWRRDDLTPYVEQRLASVMAAFGRAGPAAARLRSVAAAEEPTSPDFWLMLAELELQAGDLIAARIALRRVRAAQSAAHTARSLFLEARIERAQGHSTEALVLVDRALESGQVEARWWSFKAALLADMGRRQESLAAVQEALHIDPGDTQAGRFLEALIVPDLEER